MVGDHVLKQAGDDGRFRGPGVNDLFMAPSGPLWPLGLRQTDANRKGGRMGRTVAEERGTEKRILTGGGGDGGGGGTQMRG